MSFRNEEEVRRRRGKTSQGRFNVYQKVVLLAGGLGLFSVIGIGSGKAPILSVGVIGTTALVFFLLKNRSPKEGTGEKGDLKEILPQTEQIEGEYQDSFPAAEKEVIADIKALFPEGEKVVDIPEKFPEGQEKMAEPRAVMQEEEENLIDRQEFLAKEKVAHVKAFPAEEKVVGIPEQLPEGQERAAEPQVMLSEEKLTQSEKFAGSEKVIHEVVFPGEEKATTFPEKLSEGQEKMAEPKTTPSEGKVKREFAGNEKVARIEEMVFRLEEKVSEMQEMLLKFEEKMAAMQEMVIKPEEKIDLQSILSNLEEKSAKAV